MLRTVGDVFAVYPGNDYLLPGVQSMSLRELRKTNCGDSLFVAICAAMCPEGDEVVTAEMQRQRLQEFIADITAVQQAITE